MMSQYQPDVVVILGDLLDEGYVASDEEFFQYEEWFKDIYDVDPSTRILLAGDNDVGGEDEPIDIHKLKRHEKYFGPVNEIVTVKNWQFFKVNTLGFLRYEFTSQHEKNAMESLNTFMATALRKLDKNKHTLVFSHLPLRYWDAYFAVKVMNNIKPKAIFSGHDHKAKYRMYKTGIFSTEEYVQPTCSYRMGSIHMGIGVVILEENGSFHYTILKLPQRFFYLILYAVVSVLCLLYILLSVLCKIPRFNS
ncbi:metallophosphoesterase 1 homolog isoform X2 [Xenia sp. Carnegie-2017]|uniref:metallophosphoesterase 1 homolog isoform X2 n=1 Tax=Xenia sp. Carnegie-2017 TaxID=2897299 RepID=UPI001F038F9D|nr:metallophosphoesterase 1 homolog isoform X2 [Xenia sp. Carnegie-2017]